MTKNTLIKLSSIGFAGIVVYGTYNFIQKNEKVLNFLTGNSKLKNISSDVNHENPNNSINYELKDASNAADNVQKQTLLEIKEVSNSSTINEQKTPISTTNSTSNGIGITTKKSEPKTTSISDGVSINKSQTPKKKRLNSRTRSRQYGFLSSIN